MAEQKRVKVKFLTGVATMPRAEHNINSITTFEAGKEYSLHPELAKSWIDCGHCEIVPEKETGK